ncbi:MAG: biopolymer transporter ExbD [Candidatus Omnitrophica bacterium]|nr:biopolymer transporter ExbD [Candidatus Omnitrophota bacterium]
MHFKRHMKPEYGLAQIEITPLINILFQLVLFFMLTSSFLTQPAINIGLPRAITSEAAKYENFEISITSENLVYANGRVLTDQELDNLLKALARRKQSLLIKADKGASLGRVVKIWDKARDLGVAGLNIATNKE